MVLKIGNWAEVGARKHRKIHDVEQSEKMIPFIMRETTFGQHVRKLVSGVNIFDLDFWGPNGSCQTTNPAQLCGFWTRVSV